MSKSKFNFSYFLLGLIFIFTAVLTFRDPASNLIALAILFGCAAIFKGLFEIFFRRKFKEYTGIKNIGLLILGIVDVILGIFLLFNLNIGIITLPFIFSIWFIFDSIMGLFLSDTARLVGTAYYWFYVVMCILGIIVGFMLLFNPINAALTLAFLVGFYFMMAGINYLVVAFTGKSLD